MKPPSAHQGVIWCNGAAGGANGWSFPRPINRRLQRELRGLRILHLFGGQATFGTRIDLDPITSPDVIADAWLPPFGKDSFDAVILDPPYVSFGRHCRELLGTHAAWLATKYVVWFSSFAATSLPGCSIVKWWTVIIGNDCTLRQLVFFAPRADKLPPPQVREPRASHSLQPLDSAAQPSAVRGDTGMIFFIIARPNRVICVLAAMALAYAKEFRN